MLLLHGSDLKAAPAEVALWFYLHQRYQVDTARRRRFSHFQMFRDVQIRPGVFCVIVLRTKGSAGQIWGLSTLAKFC